MVQASDKDRARSGPTAAGRALVVGVLFMSPLGMHTAVDADDRCQAVIASAQREGLAPSVHASRLSSCIRAALEAWGGCQCGSWALVGLERGSREEVSWLASVNVNTCGVTAGEKCGEINGSYAGYWFLQ